MTTINLRLTSVSHASETVLRSLNLAIEPGDRVAVMGPSGSGKTTLLRIMAKLHTEYSGEVRVVGKVGYMPQDSRDVVVPWRRVGNLIPEPSDRKQLGLGEKAEDERQFPKFLSGGQLRRLALGHVFQYDKNIYLLDEPLTGLDLDLRCRIIEFIKNQLDADDILVFVTHYIEEAELLAKSFVYVANKGCSHYTSINEFKALNFGTT